MKVGAGHVVLELLFAARVRRNDKVESFGSRSRKCREKISPNTIQCIRRRGRTFDRAKRAASFLVMEHDTVEGEALP
jgi:hypothetical protein